ncbi:hypothetical protein ABH924_004424 [Arthrobacter sp. GAS37]|uniref:DUF6993 domain-containing protein n=1 Tax=Arthrobacter sp. GAS37 TaxID=3156261 RepID=UPI003836AD5F
MAGCRGLLLAVPLLVAGCTAPAPVVSGSTPVSSPAPVECSQYHSGCPTQCWKFIGIGIGIGIAQPGDCRHEADDGVRTEDHAAATPKPAKDALRSQLVSAGIPASAVEVSASKTPTGLDVDAIGAAARLDKDCVMGEIRAGQVSVSGLPVLASGKCFVGDSR